MNYRDKTKDELIKELHKLQQECDSLKTSYSKDNTDHKLANKKIHWMAQMLDFAPESITVHDFEGCFLYANQKTFDMHGYTQDEFLALNLHQLDVPESENLIAIRMQELLDRGKASFEVYHYKKDGTTFPLENSARFTIWGDKKAILSIATDITDRKLAEKELKDNQKILEQKINELERFNNHRVDRELKMVDLKKDINELLKKQNEKPRYRIVK